MYPATMVYEIGLMTGALAAGPAGGSVLPVRRWLGGLDDADRALLDRCDGPTLDIGCGPGRLVAALAARDIPGLGIDIARHAVRMARARGAVALERDVFAVIPGERRWHHLLLADGNIGIGGDPVRLLCRCAQLLAPTGSLLLDLDPPGIGLITTTMRLHAGGVVSNPFSWSRLGVDALRSVAAPAGLVPRDVWHVNGRWQAELVHTEDWVVAR